MEHIYFLRPHKIKHIIIGCDQLHPKQQNGNKPAFLPVGAYSPFIREGPGIGVNVLVLEKPDDPAGLGGEAGEVPGVEGRAGYTSG